MAADVLMQVLADDEPALLDHAREVARLATRVSLALGVDRRTREDTARAAELHDIALIAAAPTLRAVALLVRASHERWDGRGYPDGLRGEAIPLGARIVAVCDAFSAMREDRPYGPVLTDAEAVEELHRCSGTQFDPRVVRAFCHAHGASAVAV